MTQGLVSRSHGHPLKSNPNLGQSHRYGAMNISYERKEQPSYLVLERQRHIQDDNKKFTWESLEKMNLNELKGLTNMNFEPEDYIGEEDDEDKMYMKEYNLANEAVVRESKRKNLEKKIENYGEVSHKGGYGKSGPIQSRYKDSFKQSLGTDAYHTEVSDSIRKRINARGAEIARENAIREREQLKMIHQGKVHRSAAY
jgi:hypothetical protein